MINMNYANAMAEVLEYLKGIRKEDLEKISSKFMNFLKENASKEYKPKFDYTKPLTELELTSTSKAIISFICYKYWCQSEDEKIEFYKLLQNNEELYNKEWEENSKNMFKLKEKTQEDYIQNNQKNNLPIEKASPIGLFAKIKEFIKKFFTRKKRGSKYMETSNYNNIEENLTDIEIGKKIIEELEKKYNQKFIVKKLAKRYGMGDFDNITAICLPEKNKKIIFTVFYDMINEKIIDDDFYVKSTSFELEEFILNELNGKNKEAIVRVEIFGKRKLEKKYSVQEFSEKYSDNNFLATIIIKEKISEDELNNIFININNNYKNLFLKTLIYTISQNQFNECYKKAEVLPEINQTFIKEHHINDMYIIKIFRNEIIKIQ